VKNLGLILEILGKNAVLVQHVGEIHPFFTKMFVFYINSGKFGVNFRNIQQPHGTAHIQCYVNDRKESIQPTFSNIGHGGRGEADVL
jgi:hypothetical protein